MKKIYKLSQSFIYVFLIAYFSSILTQHGIKEWYHEAVSSIFTPPDSVFPIVWSILYTLMAISFYIILLHQDAADYKKAQTLFLTQLALNAVWCFTFFYQGWLGAGLVLIFLMIFLVYKTIKIFQKIKKEAGWLLYPYFIWLCYASFLNLLFVINNGLIIEK